MITKSNYMQFLRCTCELWIMKQRKDLAPPVDAGLQRLFDEGNEVDAFAQTLFPGGVVVDGFGAAAARKTTNAINRGATVLLQPTFMTKDLSVRCDILVKNGDVWDIYEVKSSTSVKDEHIIDVGFQRLCLEECGIVVGRTYVVHVNNKYVRQGAIDPKQLFTIEDVTAQALELIPQIRSLIPKALAVTDWSKEPAVLHLASCRDPYKCEFLPCYIGELSDERVYAIASELEPARVKAFLERGLLKPSQVPPDVLSALGDIELPSEDAEPVTTIDAAGIADKLSELQYPLYFLDYETFFPAIPRYSGYWPYSHVTFQYSVHVQREPDGTLEHVEFLATESHDPLLDLAASLRAHIGNTGSVIVWNASFEALRNKEMGAKLPEYAEFFESLNARMFDLMMIVKKGLYVDSRFGGSASIKKVLPVLCPELSYSNLEIQNGGEASSSWPALIDPATPESVCEQLRTNMLAYCERDTYAMVRLLEEFRKNAITESASTT